MVNSIPLDRCEISIPVKASPQDQMPRLFLERGIGLYLRVSRRCGKLKAKNGIIGICRAGLETLWAL